MGESGYPDIERKGSMNKRHGSKLIYPMQDSPRASVSHFAGQSNRRRSTWIISLFVLVNVVLFIVAMFINDCPKDSDVKCTLRFLGRFSFQPLKENPLFGPSSSTLEKIGALQWSKVVNQHEGWRLITCIWLHAGVVHLVANMLSLLFIGIRLEQEFGPVRVGIIYLLSAFGGSVVSALFIQNSVSVGASGALFGLLGAMLSELITNWTIYSNKFAALVTLVLIIAINLAVGILPHVDNFAHIGGFVSGFLLGFVFLVRPQFGWVNRRNIPPGYHVHGHPKSKHKAYQYILWLLALILLIVGYTVGLVMLFRGDDGNKHCSWCHYLSCVPTSRWSCTDKTISCLSSQTDNQLTLTCQSNGKTKIYPFANVSSDRTKELCIQLCT
uniref:RHOMBOID-like protein n=1 Tax=Ginkgo biloba TaxID=3311 RepID=A0A0A7E828_GINBI|nr:rhomboid protein Ginbi_RBL8a [Ginkgo biloba]